MSTILDDLPDGFQGKISLSEGRLYIANSLKGEPGMLSFLSLAERRGINANDIIWEDERALARRVKKPINLRDDSAMVAYAKKLLQDAYDLRASDIHLIDTGPQLIIQLRRMNLVRDHGTLPGETGRALLRVLYNTMGQDGKGEFSPHSRQDARIVNKKYLPADVYSVRVHTEPIAAVDSSTGLGTYMPLRLLYDAIKVEGSVSERLQKLGYPKKEAAMICFLLTRTGLLLVSGPMGSGKSTVLKHMMEGQAQDYPEKNYLSHEDPPEYPMRNVKQAIIGDSREEANKGLLRTDLNVFLEGEIRDSETAMAALDEALAGHAVLGTIHALDAFGIVPRLRNLLMNAKGNIGDPLDTLCNAKVLTGLIFQRLLPTLCERCKVPLMEYLNRPNQAERTHILPGDVEKRLMSVIDDLSGVCVRGPGCEHCKNLGFAGRTLAVEVVVTDEKLLNLIKAGQLDEARKHWKESLGGRSYVDHAIEGIAAGILDPAMTERELGAPLNIDKAIESLNEIGD